ncbi:MAG: response regulator [Oscillospiraceae bacterium]|nr:response regulator [Oscillospiraceae bacterium]
MRLLVVDDEFFVRDRIKNQLNWAELGIDNVQEAACGMEALRFIKANPPDILITDVRMPQMDGIQLAEQAQSVKPDCKVIFISGYADVPYLQSAIRLRAVSFVEKPLKMEEIENAVRVAADQLLRDRAISNNMERLQYLDSISRAAQIAKALLNAQTNAAAADALRCALDVSSYYHYVTMIAQLIPNPDSDAPREDDILELYQQTLPPDEAACVGFLKGERIVAHLFCRAVFTRWRDKLDNYFIKFTNSLSQRGYGVVYAIGKPVTALERLPDSYAAAISALPQCFYKHPGYVCYNQTRDTREYDLDGVPLTEFQLALKNESPGALLALINDVAGNLKNKAGTPPEKARRFFYSLIVLLLRASEKESLSLFEEYADEIEIWNAINKFHFLDELHQFVLQSVERYYLLLKSSSTSNSVVNRIIRFVRQNYSDPDLSITMISDHLKLSPTYVCHLFKHITGMTLGNYMTDLRIKMALELMESGDFRVKDIARQVGYRSSNYFSYIFKQHMGYSPSGIDT